MRGKSKTGQITLFGLHCPPHFNDALLYRVIVRNNERFAVDVLKEFGCVDNRERFIAGHHPSRNQVLEVVLIPRFL
jgi:hypothetical protein